MSWLMLGSRATGTEFFRPFRDQGKNSVYLRALLHDFDYKHIWILVKKKIVNRET